MTTHSQIKFAIINKNIDKIERLIEKQGRYIYYIIHNDEIKLVCKSDDKSEAKKLFIEKLAKKPKYINNCVYFVDITVNRKYVAKPNELIAGPVLLKIVQYVVGKKFNLHYEASHKSGALWYTNDDLLNNAFRFSDIKQLIKTVHDKKINIISLGGIRAVNIKNKYFISKQSTISKSEIDKLRDTLKTPSQKLKRIEDNKKIIKKYDDKINRFKYHYPIHNVKELETIYKLYKGFKSKREYNNMIKIMDNKFITDLQSSVKNFDFYPTPLACIDALDINVYHFTSFLEPSAGFGSALYYVINKDFYFRNSEFKKHGDKSNLIKTTAFEYNDTFIPFLEKHFTNTTIYNSDFLDSRHKIFDFDLIFCNPPFANGNDRKYYIKFLLSCLLLLKNSNSYTTYRVLYFLSPKLTKKDYKIGEIIQQDLIFETITKQKMKMFKNENSEDYMHYNFDDLEPAQVMFKGICDKFATTKTSVHMYEMIITKW